MLVSGLTLGVVAGIVFGGDWRRLGRLDVRWLPVLMVALGFRAIGLIVPLSVTLYLGAIVAVGVVAAVNRHLPGAPLIAIGSGLNALVIALNGGMPVDMDLAREVGAFAFEADRLHVPLTERTVLAFLSDVIPVGVARNVYSIGDVVIAAGGFWLPFAWIRRT